MNQPQKRRPFQIALGLFIAAIVIGCAVIAIWLVTKLVSNKPWIRLKNLVLILSYEMSFR
jgi:F0F1-type ATP synthase assembly protein I